MMRTHVKGPAARHDAGFTILELTTAMFILIVGLFGTITLFHFGISKLHALDEAAIAAQAVQNELEIVRSTPFAALELGERTVAVADPALARLHLADTKVTISPGPGDAPGLKQVTVSVRWIAENGRRSERTVTTLVAEALP